MMPGQGYPYYVIQIYIILRQWLAGCYATGLEANIPQLVSPNLQYSTSHRIYFHVFYNTQGVILYMI